MAQNYRRTLTKHRKTEKGPGRAKLEKIEMNMHLGKFEKRRPTFFQIYGISVYTSIKMSLTQLENHSQLLCGHDFANERFLVCQFDVWNS